MSSYDGLDDDTLIDVGSEMLYAKYGPRSGKGSEINNRIWELIDRAHDRPLSSKERTNLLTEAILWLTLRSSLLQRH